MHAQLCAYTKKITDLGIGANEYKKDNFTLSFEITY